MKNITKRSTEDLWQVFFARQQDRSREKHPWWDCCGFPPECDEVKLVADGLPADFTIVSNDGNDHLGNRQWHINQIAALYRWWKDGHPIIVKNGDVVNGAHRLIAARCKGMHEIEVIETP